MNVYTPPGQPLLPSSLRGAVDSELDFCSLTQMNVLFPLRNMSLTEKTHGFGSQICQTSYDTTLLSGQPKGTKEEKSYTLGAGVAG